MGATATAPAATAPAVRPEVPAVLATGLTKRYGRHIGCAGVDLEVPRGSVFGLLGPNGAGKSTLVRLLLGLLRPDDGHAYLLGRSTRDPASRRRVGYLPELFRYPDWLTATEVLVHHGRLAGLDPDEATRQARDLLHLVGLEERARSRVGSFSKGMQQRLGLACALLGEPELVFLDEPTSALDPLGRREVRALIRRLQARGTTVFLNSHLLTEVEEVCDTVAVMRRGRVVATGSLDELLAPAAEVELWLEDPAGRAAQVMAGAGRAVRVNGLAPPVAAVASAWASGTVAVTAWRVRLDTGGEVPDLVAGLVRAGVAVHAVRPVRRELEDLFVALAAEGGGGV
ncbi:MAG: ABC transporter ATP-binding protein [Clostridia bacterium]|nr:ABC transporter ATP-binding protein [Clostridia bacterium]